MRTKNNKRLLTKKTIIKKCNCYFCKGKLVSLKTYQRHFRTSFASFRNNQEEYFLYVYYNYIYSIKNANPISNSIKNPKYMKNNVLDDIEYLYIIYFSSNFNL